MTEENREVHLEFTSELVVNYPKSAKKISLEVKPYSLAIEEFYDPVDMPSVKKRTLGPEAGSVKDDKFQTTHVSPYGLEFHSPKEFPEGTLLKIHLSLPDYWSRKQKFVEYSRIDSPSKLRILAKVVASKDIGKRGKKKLTLVQTVNIDEIDEMVLKSFLQEAK